MTEQLVANFKSSLDEMQSIAAQGQVIRERMISEEKGDRVEMITALQEIGEQLGELIQSYRKQRNDAVISFGDGISLSVQEANPLIALAKKHDYLSALIPSNPDDPTQDPERILDELFKQFEAYRIQDYHLTEVAVDFQKLDDDLPNNLLDSLSFLRKMVLKNCRTSDANPNYSGLSELLEFELLHSDSNVLATLDQAAKLERVMVFGANMTSEELSVFADCPRLRTLELPCNKLENLTPLSMAKLPMVTKLNISGNVLSSINGIQSLQSLEHVVLKKQLSTDLDYMPLLDLSSLKRLEVDGSQGFWITRKQKRILQELRNRKVDVIN